MARITLAFLVSLVAYFAYYTLTSEAQPVGSLTLGAEQDTLPGTIPGGGDSIGASGAKQSNGRFVMRRPASGGYHDRAAARLYGWNLPGNKAYQVPYRRMGQGAAPEQPVLVADTDGPPAPASSADSGSGKGEQRVYFRAGYRTDTAFFDDDDEFIGDGDIVKRFDDYGHMRFGKRGGEGDQFDDYGHMRFGR